jgi:hypothetical protein
MMTPTACHLETARTETHRSAAKRLHRMAIVACGKAFDRDDVLAVARRRKRQAGEDTLAFDDDRARAAALIVPLPRAPMDASPWNPNDTTSVGRRLKC